MKEGGERKGLKKKWENLGSAHFGVKEFRKEKYLRDSYVNKKDKYLALFRNIYQSLISVT